MNKILWPLVVFCSIVSVYWVFTGIGPKSVPVIKPSNFNTAGEVAEHTYRQLYPRLMNHQAIVFGIEDNRPEQKEIFRRFVQLLAEGFKTPVVVVSDTPMEAKEFEPAHVEAIYLDHIPEQHRRQRLNEILLSGKKIIFSLSTFDAAHFRREAMVNVIEEAMNFKSISFILTRVGLHSDEVTIANFCKPPIKDEMNYNPIACLVMAKAELLKKNKRISTSKMIGVVERQSERDFMIYTWLPKN